MVSFNHCRISSATTAQISPSAPAKASPKRGSLSWFLRIPLMAYRNMQNTRRSRKVSYSQCGEDIIVRSALGEMGIAAPTYLDIGANDPIDLSNTYALYRAGCHGICIEPNPHLFPRLKRVRPRDVCLQIGLWNQPDPTAKFFRMSAPTLGTFSRDEAAHYEREGYAILDEIPTPLLTPGQVIDQHLAGRSPDFVSLDAEGVDMIILNAWPFAQYRPAVFCIETVTFSNDHSQCVKETEAAELLSQQGYFLYADTYINSIFVDAQRWHVHATTR